VPFVAESIGRRLSMAIFLTITGVSAAIGFGYVFYLPGNPLTLFFVCVFFMGLGGANFANYTIWLPELYTTDCRASAIGFISSVGRFVGVAMTFVLAEGIRSYGSLGMPVAIVAMAFVFGLALLPFAKETKGHVLPA
jgi:MFS family permease